MENTIRHLDGGEWFLHRGRNYVKIDAAKVGAIGHHAVSIDDGRPAFPVRDIKSQDIEVTTIEKPRWTKHKAATS